MTITGNLKTMQLAELLQWLSQSKKTGTLVVDNGKVTKQVFFREGRVISSSSTDPKEHLGHFLVSHGLITEQELSQAIEMQERSKMLLGKILVTIGVLEEATLHKLLRMKAEESIYGLFTWTEADFRFVDGELPQHTMIPVNLDVTAITLEGVRRLDEWRRIREVIPSFHAIPVSMTELDDPSLPTGVRKILQLVDDHRTIEEICLETHANEFFVCRVLFEEIQGRRLKIVRPRAPKPGPAAAERAADGGGQVGAKALLEGAQGHLDAGRHEYAVRYLRAARSLEPDSREVASAVDVMEKKIRERLEEAGVKLDSVPKLSVNLEELTASKITPQEGFMITRINGSYDIQSIVKISSMPQLDALLVFWRLLKAGHITLVAKKS